MYQVQVRKMQRKAREQLSESARLVAVEPAEPDDLLTPARVAEAVAADKLLPIVTSGVADVVPTDRFSSRGRGPQPCPGCGRAFRTESGLRAHAIAFPAHAGSGGFLSWLGGAGA